MPTQREWNHRVADAAAAHMSAMTPDELLGVGPDDIDSLGPADFERLSSAIEYLHSRLHRMSGGNSSATQ